MALLPDFLKIILQNRGTRRKKRVKDLPKHCTARIKIL